MTESVEPKRAGRLLSTSGCAGSDGFLEGEPSPKCAPRSDDKPNRQEYEDDRDCCRSNRVGNGQEEKTTSRNVFAGRYECVRIRLRAQVDERSNARFPCV